MWMLFTLSLSGPSAEKGTITQSENIKEMQIGCNKIGFCLLYPSIILVILGF